jgi:hypothetical protein
MKPFEFIQEQNNLIFNSILNMQPSNYAPGKEDIDNISDACPKCGYQDAHCKCEPDDQEEIAYMEMERIQDQEFKYGEERQ